MPGKLRSTCGLFLVAVLVAAAQTPAADEDPERVAVGQEAPEIALPDLDDGDHMLSALRGEKNAVLVFYRGGW